MPAAATRAILSRVSALPSEQLALGRCHGRILRQTVHAERDNPPFDRVCMDGIAIASTAFNAGTRHFRIQATQAAGDVPLRLDAPDAAIEVMTGAVLPHGTDCVIPLEEYDLAAAQLTLRAEASAEPWRSVQRRGSDSMPGVPMLTIGMRLGAAEVAVVASAGLAEVAVSRQPRVMVISTGDELIEPGQPIADHQVRRSNSYAVNAALRLQGFEAVAATHLPDHKAFMQQQLGEILGGHDVLVLSGGVSKGKFDFVPTVLKELGVEEVFYQVAQRPGRPMWFGVGPAGQLVFGLPGNPVSTLICLARYVLPALRELMLWHAPARERVAMREAADGRKMTYFMPVALGPEAASLAMASARPPHGSGDFLALAGTDGFVELPPQPEGYAAGFIADFYRW
ncbi:MAG: molybdopterin molybdotransferase MoeA [Steroidobacteraceae bacterium]